MDETALEGLIAGFHAIHRQRFSYANPGSPVEIVSLRVAAIGRLPKAEGKAVVASKGERQPARRRKVWMRGGWHDLAVWDRAQIGTETLLVGPAVVEESYTTVLISDGWICRRDTSGHLIAERKQA